MSLDFYEIMRKYNVHHMFLNESGIVSALQECYKKGKVEGSQEVLEWLSGMDYLSDNIQYIKEEWQNQNLKK